MAVGDYVLSGLGGAASGAATGAAGGVPGAIVGGVVGAGMALFGQAQADKQEKEAEATFVKDRPDYETIKRDAHLQQAFDFGDTIDCFCTD